MYTGKCRLQKGRLNYSKKRFIRGTNCIHDDVVNDFVDVDNNDDIDVVDDDDDTDDGDDDGRGDWIELPKEKDSAISRDKLHQLRPKTTCPSGTLSTNSKPLK